MLKSSTICFFLLLALFGDVSLSRTSPTPPSSYTPVQAANQRLNISREVRHELLLLPHYSLFDWS